MIRILLLFLFLQTNLVSAQNPDSLIKTIYSEKTDSARIKRIYDVIENNGMLNPKDVIYYHTKILEETKKNNDKVCESVITTELGYTIANISNLGKGTEMIFVALKMAEETGNKQAIGIAYHNLSLVYNGSDGVKAMSYLQKALLYSEASHNYSFFCSETAVLGFFHLGKNNLDSALFYMQKAYGLAIQYKVDVVLSNILTGLSSIQYQMGNKQLAGEYLYTALQVPYVKLNATSLADVYMEIAGFYKNERNFDSSLFYARKAYQITSERSLFTNGMWSASLLMDLYTDKNSDSTLKYTNIYYKAKDSVAGDKQVQKLQVLAFEENIRQEKIKEEEEKAAKERKHNIQYASIAIGIITFIILFLLLSRSIIVNTKWIEFLGVTGLLVVFEFINLIIHPYLAHYTNDSPLVMLLVLVLIAMLLVPLHHKLEKWVTGRIVEKNKQIRLAAAKRTIAKLEGEMETKPE
jgi:tetratricopeptide (TPR) repeat protein